MLAAVHFNHGIEYRTRIGGQIPPRRQQPIPVTRPLRA